MTNLSPFQSKVAYTFLDKGSIYGKASKTPSSYSFQQSTRGYRSIYANTVETLSNEVTLFSPYIYSIIVGNENQVRTITRIN
jgi:hypothetical protein